MERGGTVQECLRIRTPCTHEATNTGLQTDSQLVKEDDRPGAGPKPQECEHS